MIDDKHRWLEWAERIRAQAQNGLAYSQNPYERERYEILREIAAEILDTYSDLTFEPILDLLKGETGYATPKVDVRGVVFKGEKICLVRERGHGAWTLPGGWADVGDSVGETATKEVKEEAGLDVKPVKVLAIFDKRHHHHERGLFHLYRILVHCELIGGEFVDNIETDAMDFFARDAIPPLIRFKMSQDYLDEAFAHFEDPSRATSFD